MTAPEPAAISTDLVEYLVLAVPGPFALDAIGAELARVVDSAAIRVLDLVVVRVNERGEPSVVDLDEIRGLDAARESIAYGGVLLSTHDLELVSLAVGPGDCAVVIVAEDRWAGPLAAAARSLGGEIRAGERIARDRVELALASSRTRPEEAAP